MGLSLILVPAVLVVEVHQRRPQLRRVQAVVARMREAGVADVESFRMAIR